LAVVLAATLTLAAVHVSRGGPGLNAANDAGSRATVAVLPLRGLGDSSAARVGEGLAEELTTAFAQLPAVTVRSSARSREAVYAGDNLREIGDHLGVALVLDGSVQRGAGRMRIILRLVRVEDEVTVWARAFDVESGDLITGQQRIAQATVDELRPRFDALARRPVP
jgi:serine/threonine-protein kinase